MVVMAMVPYFSERLVMQLKFDAAIVLVVLVLISGFVGYEVAYLSANAGKQISNLVPNAKELRPITENKKYAPKYNLSFAAYDAAFANEMKLRNELVNEMPIGVPYIGLHMITEAEKAQCYINVVLDKSFRIDMPDKNFTPPPWLFKHLVDFPRVKPDENDQYSKWPNLRKLYDPDYSERIGYGAKQIYFGALSKDQKTGELHRNGRIMFLFSYTQNGHEKYNFLTLKTNCFDMAQRFHQDKVPVLQIPTKQETSLLLPYDGVIKPGEARKTSHYMEVKLPEVIVSKAKPFILRNEVLTRKESVEYFKNIGSK